jgi:hypothetical protein
MAFRTIQAEMVGYPAHNRDRPDTHYADLTDGPCCSILGLLGHRDSDRSPPDAARPDTNQW